MPATNAQQVALVPAGKLLLHYRRDRYERGLRDAGRLAMTLRPRRSVLYMPGSNLRALEKARTLPADGLILDLEDAVAPRHKELARVQIVKTLNQGGYGRRELIVRVNGLDTEWGADDVRAIAELPIDAVLFPKVESASHVLAAVASLKEAGSPDTLAVWAMAETPKGIIGINEVASASPQLRCIVVGTSDLSKEMRVPHTPSRLGFLVPLTSCVLAARANGLDVLDGVHLNLTEPDQFHALCLQGKALGFDGKTLIHPTQVDAANDVFAPSKEEVQAAREILDAWEAAHAEGKGVVVVNGNLVENLHVEEASRTLALAAGIADLIDSGIV